MHALMCVGAWSLLGYVKNSDLMDITGLPKEDKNKTEYDVHDGWNAVLVGL